MPYIDPGIRDILDQNLNRVGMDLTRCGERTFAGILNYCITYLVNIHLQRLSLIEVGPEYRHLNELIGVLECCKLELYRRMVAPYEDKKLKENGDVYNEEQEDD